MTNYEKIISEINEKYEGCDICEYFEDYDYEENDISEYRSVGSINDIIDIIKKYIKNEEKTAKWKPNDFFHDTFMCSNCFKRIEVLSGENPPDICPNCYRKMSIGE